MFWLACDEPGGKQKAFLAYQARAVPGALWINAGQDAPDDAVIFEVWERYTYPALAACAARLRDRTSPPEHLIISTVSGFGGEAQRPVRKEDHTPQSHRLAAAAFNGDVLPRHIVISDLSTLYERYTAVIASTINQAWDSNKALDLVGAFAGSALTHLLWDLKKSGIPVLAGCWTTLVGKRQVPYIPRSVHHAADLVLTGVQLEEVDTLDRWKEIVDAVEV